MTLTRDTGLIKRKAVFHSDHGSQYRSKQFTKYCGGHGICRSMGGRMECWDNAAAIEVADYVAYFNNQRLHQTLDYQTPNERLTQLKTAA